MSDVASEEHPSEEAALFVERDDRETPLGYGDGGVPLYLAIAWAGFMVVYVAVMATVALPDLLSWWGS